MCVAVSSASFDFPGQLENWFRVQGVAPKLYFSVQQILYHGSELVIVPRYAFTLSCFQGTSLFCSWNRSLSVFAEVSKNTVLPFASPHF